MRGVTKEAKRQNGRSYSCEHCEFKLLLNPRVCVICRRAFIEGFKKGTKWAEKKLKENGNETL